MQPPRWEYIYPPDQYKGRGIVICGGGERYFPCAWVCINMLRFAGCGLPVELWHFRNEMPPHRKLLIEALGVRCINADEVRRIHSARLLGGWELKAYAIIHSSFQEVLLLDSDNVPVDNPTYLFDAPQYLETGAVFWPDYCRLAPDRSAWEVTGVAYRDEPELESGQLVIDKSRCWKALNLAMHLNEWSDFFYDHFHGDKETFHLAWRKAGQNYAMPPYGIEDIGGYCMAQHDFEGKRLFQHRNLRKWTLKGNPRDENFLYESECIGFLDDLARRIQEENQTTWTDRERSLHDSICLQREFLYVRRGFDQRKIELLPDGSIGSGTDDSERTWRIVSGENRAVLQICGDQGRTCELTSSVNGAFSGWWSIGEHMPAYLIPARNDARMNVGIVTTNRPENYIQDTLADLFQSCKEPVTVDLFVGTKDSEYLAPYRSDPRIVMHELTADEWKLIEPWGPHRRCSFNFWRAFRHYAELNKSACLFEDDVVFCNHFFDRLRETVAEIELKHAKYILATYTPFELNSESGRDRARYYSSYDASSFYGNQGMYYPASVLQDLEKYFKAFAVDNPVDPADLAVGNFCTEGDILYGTRCALVQHIGRVTTGLGNFHEAPNFDKNYNPNSR